jgi:hypothetical protein
MWHKPSYIHIYFLKRFVSNRGSLAEAMHGGGRVLHVFLVGCSACLSLIFCKFMMGPSRFILGALQSLAPLWLQVWLQDTHRTRTVVLQVRSTHAVIKCSTYSRGYNNEKSLNKSRMCTEQVKIHHKTYGRVEV